MVRSWVPRVVWGNAAAPRLLHASSASRRLLLPAHWRPRSCILSCHHGAEPEPRSARYCTTAWAPRWTTDGGGDTSKRWGPVARSSRVSDVCRPSSGGKYCKLCNSDRSRRCVQLTGTAATIAAACVASRGHPDMPSGSSGELRLSVTSLQARVAWLGVTSWLTKTTLSRSSGEAAAHASANAVDPSI